MTDAVGPFQSIAELARLIESGELSPTELVKTHLDRIAALDRELNSYISVFEADARREAANATQEIRSGNYRGPLHGIPVGLKDNWSVAGHPTTSGSTVLRDYVPTHDATVVERLRAAGAIVIGKHNMNEFAYTGDARNLRFGPILNPWNPEYSPSGTSGGSAAAVAAGLCGAAIGTDGAGSTRRPAAACGIVGLKATFGRVSRHGQYPAAQSSVDHPGILTRTVEDAAIVLGAVAGQDDRDPASAASRVVDYRQQLRRDPSTIRVGIPEKPFGPASADALKAVDDALATMERLGMSVREVSLPHAGIELTQAMEAPILAAEGHATRLHDLLRQHHASIDDLGPDIRTFYYVARAMPASVYVTAQKARRLLIRDFDRALRAVDVIVTPMAVASAQTRTQDLMGKVTVDGADVAAVSGGRAFSIPYNLTGLPALSVPCGFTAAGLPIGLEIAGRPFDEATVLAVAHAYEQAAPWHTANPPV